MTPYQLLEEQAQGFCDAEPFYVPLLANASALLWEALPDINWAGFYFLRNGVLTLGPFQGRPACIHIPLGRGVCGTAAAEDRVQRVGDVHQFPGHIACDSASRSEIVVPLHRSGAVVAVLDIDSPLLQRFSQEDEAGLLRFARVIETGMTLD